MCWREERSWRNGASTQKRKSIRHVVAQIHCAIFCHYKILFDVGRLITKHFDEYGAIRREKGHLLLLLRSSPLLLASTFFCYFVLPPRTSVSDRIMIDSIFAGLIILFGQLLAHIYGMLEVHRPRRHRWHQNLFRSRVLLHRHPRPHHHRHW